MTKGSALRTIREIGSLARETRCAEAFAQDVVDVLDGRIGFEYGAILLSEGSGALFPLALARPDDRPESLGEDKNYVRSRLAVHPDGLTGWVARHGVSVRVADVRDDPRYFSMRDDIRSELCVPIRVAGRTLGVFNTETVRRRAYSSRDQELLETIAIEVAAVLQTSQLRRRRTPGPSDFVTLCATCKRYREAGGGWHPIEELVTRTSRSKVSHGVCPECYSDWCAPPE